MDGQKPLRSELPDAPENGAVSLADWQAMVARHHADPTLRASFLENPVPTETQPFRLSGGNTEQHAAPADVGMHVFLLTLKAKRRGELRRQLRRTVWALGTEWRKLIDRFAAEVARPAARTRYGDAIAFARWLLRQPGLEMPLRDLVRYELCSVEMQQELCTPCRQWTVRIRVFKRGLLEWLSCYRQGVSPVEKPHGWCLAIWVCCRNGRLWHRVY